MHSSTALLFGGVIFVALFQSGWGIKCYQCNSHNETACKDPFNERDADHLLKECPRQPIIKNEMITLENGKMQNKSVSYYYTYCRKTTQKAALSGMKDEDKRIIRTCGYLNDTRIMPEEDESKNDLKCYRRVGTFEVELLYCGCFADGCNAAGQLQSFGIITILLCTLFHQLFIRF